MKSCKHVREGQPRRWLTTAVARATLSATTLDLNEQFELCAMCASFLAEALEAMVERGCVPVPIDRVNTRGLV